MKGTSSRTAEPAPGVNGVPTQKLAEQSDETLAAEAAREGSDGPAFVELVNRYRERVWRICFRLLGHADDAQDAAQEVFVRLFTQRGRFQGNSKYSTWVHGIAVRTCLMFRRGRGRRRRHETTAAKSERPLGGPTQPALSLDVREMLDCLDEEDRALVILKYCESYSYEELAEIFGLSASACKMRVSRAKERIQQEFSFLM
jgi:RNA polymerase sigma-70 factor (ECF subfamily)